MVGKTAIRRGKSASLRSHLSLSLEDAMKFRGRMRRPVLSLWSTPVSYPLGGIGSFGMPKRGFESDSK
jgi:hypothetical protein